MKSIPEFSKSLLLVSPHFQLFIRDQMNAISRHFAHTTVLIPHPYFPHVVLNIPLFEKRFLFVKNAKDSRKTPAYGDIDFFYPQFFMLPTEVMRRRVAVVSARSSANVVKKNAIKFDLSHLHRLDVGFTGAILKELYETPFVITCHGSDVYDFPLKDNYRHSIAKYTLGKVDHVIAVCKSDSEKLLSLGLDPCKLSIIPNGFDERLFSPIPKESARARLRLPRNKRIILAVGTLEKVKGHVNLIEAMHRVLRARTDVLAVIVGSGPLEAKLQKEISKLELDGKVLLIGREPHNKIPLWINASDVFVMPSLNEGFPTVIPEVMACGKPIIGTNVGGIPDAISDENVGILVDANNSEALTQAIVDSLNHIWSSERICEYAKQYSMSVIVEQVLKIYRGVLEKREAV